MGKKKVLVTDTAPLYPPLWGGPKRIWHLYSNLSRDLFDLTYVGVDVNIHDGLKYRFKKIDDSFREIDCALPAHYYLWHAAERNLFKNASLDLFIYLRMHTDWHFKHVLNAQNSDIVIFSHPWSSLCVKKSSEKIFIYDAHNCEYLLMGQILGKHPLKSLVLSRVRAIEQDACRKSDFIIACSQKEKEDLMRLYKVPENKLHIITNGTTVRESINPQSRQIKRKEASLFPEDKAVIFVGAYYKPNIDAARFIIQELAPRLKEFIFFIAGTVGDAFRSQQIPGNVRIFGMVSTEELNSLLSASDIAINPMFDGSGINIKMLDYMSSGLPIVTTECGARGLDTYRKVPMAVSSADKFGDNIKMLIANTDLCRKMSEDGRSLAAEYYDWKMLSKKLEQVIMEKIR